MEAFGPALSAEVVLDAGAAMGEGARWDAASGRLLWVDIEAGLVHRFHPASGADEVFAAGQPVGAVAPRAGGGLVLALRDGFALAPAWGSPPSLVAPLGAGGPGPGMRMNDGACDRAGRFWAGTMALDYRPGAGALYRLDPDHRVTTMLEGVAVSNGLGWSPDGRRFYYVDSPTGGVDAFDADPEAGTIGRRRRLVDIPRREGLPDGLAVDGEGAIWVALWGGRGVQRYRPDGRLCGRVEVGAANVTSCALGGPAGDLLFVTTAGAASSPEAGADAHAGALWCCPVVTSGPPAAAFGG